MAVQNSVDRRELGVATAATGFFRALGGAVGAAALGAVFAAQAGTAAAGRVAGRVDLALAAAVTDAVQQVSSVGGADRAAGALVVRRLPGRAALPSAPAGPRARRTDRRSPRRRAGRHGARARREGAVPLHLRTHG